MSNQGFSLPPIAVSRTASKQMSREITRGSSGAGKSILELKAQKKMLKMQLDTVDAKYQRAKKHANDKKKMNSTSSPALGKLDRVQNRGKGTRSSQDLSATLDAPVGARRVGGGGLSPVRMRPERAKYELMSAKPFKSSMIPEAVKMKELKRRANRMQPKEVVQSKAPRAGAYRKQQVPRSLFPIHYKRGELPCLIEHRAGGNALTWTVPLDNLDYEHYLPIFFDGIREKEQPYQFIARQGVTELLAACTGYPYRLLPVLPAIMKPLRLALNTRDASVMVCAMHCIQRLVETNEEVGEALIPYYRQLLSPFNLFYTKRNNIGDQIDYGQSDASSHLGDLVLQTLETLERCGGEDAFINIKYMIPTYESCT